MIDRGRLYLELSRPFTLVAPALGVVSGAVTAAGAVPRESWSTGLLLYPALGALMAATLNAANIYTGEFKADELGQHRIELVGSSATLGQLNAKANVLVSDLNREYYSAAQNSDLLKRIAAETGGKYYTPAQTQSLLDDLTYRQTPYSERVTKDLWDMPVNFMLLVGLLSAEWFLRKREGLA